MLVAVVECRGVIVKLWLLRRAVGRMQLEQQDVDRSPLQLRGCDEEMLDAERWTLDAEHGTQDAGR